MKLAKVVATMLLIWGLSLSTVFILRGWGPVEAAFRYSGQNAELKAGSFLGALIMTMLVLLYVFGRIAEIMKVTFVSHLTGIRSLFFGE